MSEERISAIDKYECPFDDRTKQIAYDELHEDDNIRVQALLQFREWIEKNPCIKKCRTDTRFLLRFLRARKFNVPQACEMLRRYLSMYQLYPKWFKNLDINDEFMEKLVRMGFFVPLPKRDEFGRQLVYLCFKNFDSKICTSVEMLRICFLIAEFLIDDELSQVHGYIVVYHDEYPLDVITLLTLNDIKITFDCIQNALPVRLKELNFVNVPKFARFFVELIMNSLTPKMKKRVIMHDSREDLYKNIDASLLPKEYGGTIPLEQIIDKLIIRLREKRNEILSIDDLEIEVTAEESEANMDIGSFRKLQVD